MRFLLVDDDPALRTLVRATLDAAELDLAEAASAEQAHAAIRASRPDAVALALGTSRTEAVGLCRELKTSALTRDIPVVLLTASNGRAEDDARAAGADAVIRKPFSPLELLSVVERLAGDPERRSRGPRRTPASDEQILLHARELRRLLALEPGDGLLRRETYERTVTALVGALESKDAGTREHSQRVQRYAVELASAIAPGLARDESARYGFLLHDVGKIGIPDEILRKPRPLSDDEQRLMRTHTIVGEQLLGGVGFLSVQGLKIVRHHHERWDGQGYPDALERAEVPLGARVFAVADTLDAITSDRPYRKARSWEWARLEILHESGRQFDPDVVDAFREREPDLRRIARDFNAVAA